MCKKANQLFIYIRFIGEKYYRDFPGTDLMIWKLRNENGDQEILGHFVVTTISFEITTQDDAKAYEVSFCQADQMHRLMFVQDQTRPNRHICYEPPPELL